MKFLNWIKKFSPFLCISATYFLLILLITALFNYYNMDPSAWNHRTNIFYLLIRWDSIHYLDIALKGYTGQLVLFPLYPLLIAAFSFFLPSVFSGFLVSFLSLAVALYYFYKLLRLIGSEESTTRTIILLLFFPSAMFFPLIYTEALFLALLISFFYYAQKGHWLTAAGIGFLATLTRNVGIFLWPVYLIFLFNSLTDDYLRKKFFSLIKKKEFWYSLIIPAGLLLYCLYSFWEFGNLFAFISGQKDWAQWRTFMWPGRTLYNFYHFIFFTPASQFDPYNFIRMVVIEGGSFLFLLTATIYWLVKKDWPYAFFCLCNTLLFSCMFPMLSVNRYAVVVFPIFIFLEKITRKNNWLFYSLLSVFFIFFIFNVYLFSTGAWTG